MKILQYLIPKFLKKIDHYLLLRYPVLWETRVHFVVFYSLILGNVLALGLGMIYPVSKANIPDFEQVKGYLFYGYILSFLVLGYYAYQQSIKRRAFYSLKEILLQVVVYAFATLSVLGNALVMPNVIKYRVQRLVAEDVLVKDVKSILDEEYRADLTL